MNESIFRKQSLDRISSPEQLTDYIRVSNPSVWVILAAVVVLMVSVLIWSVFGTLPTTLTVTAYVQGGAAVCYVDSGTAAKLKAGMTAKIDNTSGKVTEVSAKAISKTELGKKYTDADTVKSLTAGQWNYPVQAKISGVTDGLYEMVITTDQTKPISFVLN